MRETKRITELPKSGPAAGSMRDDSLMPAGWESANRAAGAMRFAYCALRTAQWTRGEGRRSVGTGAFRNGQSD